jgi:hypothetical protein
MTVGVDRCQVIEPAGSATFPAWPFAAGATNSATTKKPIHRIHEFPAMIFSANSIPK